MENKTIISTESSNPKTVDIDISSTLDIVNLMNDEDKKVSEAVLEQNTQIAAAIDLIVDKLSNLGHLLYFGAGTSGRLGVLDASECPPTFGVSKELVRGYIAGGDYALRNAVEGAEDNFEQGKLDLISANVQENDVVVGISASGNPKWLIGVMQEAKLIGISTIGITCNEEAEIKKYSDIFVPIMVGQEAITGSSRLKAGTAQKMVLNMLSTGSMIKLGKTYKNFMIDVQPTNEKLKDRAVRIVSEIAKTDKKTAIEALEIANFDVKTAIVSLFFNCSPIEAQNKLQTCNGILRKIIE